MITVWVTRSQPGAEATAERIRALGFAPFVAPLLEVRFEPGGPIDLDGVAALAFTSGNGVRAFGSRTPERRLTVFAVGQGTAEAARDAGFASVIASEGDVLALARSIPSGGLVLHAGAAEPAADLVLALERRGVSARGIVVYRTVVALLTRSELERAANAEFVLLHSAKAARAFRGMALDRPRPVCLSAAVAQASSSDAARPIVARAPNEDALLAALTDAAK